MSKNNTGLTAFVSLAGALTAAAYFYYSSRSAESKVNDLEKKCSLQKLLAILEELQLQYTPYYAHYYHLLVALNQEYSGKPAICAKLKEKIEERLELKTTEI